MKQNQKSILNQGRELKSEFAANQVLSLSVTEKQNESWKQPSKSKRQHVKDRNLICKLFGIK